jgi:hypothetical protein
MKTRLFTLTILLTALPAFTQGTRCVQLHYRDSSLCTFSDGTGVLTDYDGHGGASESPYSDPVAWHRLYTKLMQEDTDKLQARVAQLKAVDEQRAKDAAAFDAHHAAVMKSLSITSKKPCITAGFAWSHGQCSVKDGVAR